MTAPAPQQTWALIREWNAHLPPDEHLTDAQCQDLASLIKSSATAFGLPRPFALACLMQESLCWPAALNRNLKVGVPDTLDRHDVGIAQLHIHDLVDETVPARATVEAAIRFALDPHRAVPFAFHLLANLVGAAQHHHWGARADPRAKNPYWAACVFYNSGQRGGTRVIEAGNPKNIPDHADNVKGKEQRIAAALGLPSVMADVA